MPDQLTLEASFSAPPAPDKTSAGWPTSRRNGGRLQIGTVADIKSESPAGFASEYLAGLNRNPQPSR